MVTAPDTRASDADTVADLPDRGHTVGLLGLFLVSGAAALIYQVLWVRELGLLFGSTAQAAAMAIAIFFAGLASGGWFWGRRVASSARPLRWFGLLELGIAATALGYFLLVDAYVAAYHALFQLVGDRTALDTVMKALVAATVLLPPAWLMGGTLPVLGQHLVRGRQRLATTGSVLYAVNTFGSALGALAAGFVLPLVLGFRGAYLLAVLLDVVVGVAAVFLARRQGEPVATRRDVADATPAEHEVAEVTPRPAAAQTGARDLRLPPWLIWAAAFVSGFTTLAVEVIWTRLFSQVPHNSAYTYALVLATFLLALSLGAAIANLLARSRRMPSELLLGVLLLACAAMTAISPWLFSARTDGLRLVGADADWLGYVMAVGGLAAVAMLLPGVVLGATLPYLLRTLQARVAAPGDTIGRLVATNTVGGILGALAAGFVLLPVLGAWRSLLVLAALYPALVALLAVSRPSAARLGAALAATLGAVGLLLVSPEGLSIVRLAPDRDESLVEVREGSQATVAVVSRGDDLALRVNNHYTLGGTRGLDAERDQTVVPMLSQSDNSEVFYLGMGTGITAGASLAFPSVERVEVCELVDDVVGLASDHFRPWSGGLFDDDRVTIRAEDGRTCLARDDATYDLIVSDLFTPWKAGTGNLYTRDHYATARERLEPGGRYVQWLPLYQLSENELGIVANTMDEVFDQVTLWRGDLFAERSIVALVGEDGGRPLDPDVLTTRGRELVDEDLPDGFFEAMALRMYVGNVTASGRFADAPINTDTLPHVEYEAPRTQRAVRAGDATFLTGSARESLYEDLAADVPPERDPYLAELDARQHGYVHAGRSYSVFRFLDGTGHPEDAEPWLDEFLRRSPPDARGREDLSPARRMLPRLDAPVPGAAASR